MPSVACAGAGDTSVPSPQTKQPAFVDRPQERDCQRAPGRAVCSGSYSSGWPRDLWSTQVSVHGDARVVVRIVALATLEVTSLAICGLSVLCARGPRHQATVSGRGSPVSHPAQTLGPGQGAYAGVSMCLIKKQAHESQPCNYSIGQDAGPWSWCLVFKRNSIRM